MKKIVKFIKLSIKELRYTEFPTRKQTIKLSSLVLLISIILALSLYGMDILFNSIRTALTSINF